MKKIILLQIILLFIISCTNEKKDDNKLEYSKQVVKTTVIDNKLLKIIISDGYFFYWDSKKDKITKDAFFDKIKKNKNIIPIIINQIDNLEYIEENICSKKEKLLKGDLMYLLLVELDIIHNFDCLKIQFDVLDENCKYPVYLLDYIHNNRKKVAGQVKKCYQN